MNEATAPIERTKVVTKIRKIVWKHFTEKANLVYVSVVCTQYCGTLTYNTTRLALASYGTSCQWSQGRTVSRGVRGEAQAAVDFSVFWTSLWCVTVTLEQAVWNWVNTEKILVHSVAVGLFHEWA